MKEKILNRRVIRALGNSFWDSIINPPMYYYHVDIVINNHPEIMKGVREFETCND